MSNFYIPGKLKAGTLFTCSMTNIPHYELTYYNESNKVVATTKLKKTIKNSEIEISNDPTLFKIALMQHSPLDDYITLEDSRGFTINILRHTFFNILFASTIINGEIQTPLVYVFDGKTGAMDLVLEGSNEHDIAINNTELRNNTGIDRKQLVPGKYYYNTYTGDSVIYVGSFRKYDNDVTSTTKSPSNYFLNASATSFLSYNYTSDNSLKEVSRDVLLYSNIIVCKLTNLIEHTEYTNLYKHTNELVDLVSSLNEFQPIESISCIPYSQLTSSVISDAMDIPLFRTIFNEYIIELDVNKLYNNTEIELKISGVYKYSFVNNRFVLSRVTGPTFYHPTPPDFSAVEKQFTKELTIKIKEVCSIIGSKYTSTHYNLYTSWKIECTDALHLLNMLNLPSVQFLRKKSLSKHLHATDFKTVLSGTYS